MNKTNMEDESPGLVVMEDGYSCSEGCGFKPLRHILDGHFFTYMCCKNSNVCMKRLLVVSYSQKKRERERERPKEIHKS